MAGFAIPSMGHPARELMGGMAALAEVLAPVNAGKLPPIWLARKRALEFLEAEPAAKRVNSVIVRADTDERWLVSFGKRGGWRKEWNFGTGRS